MPSWKPVPIKRVTASMTGSTSAADDEDDPVLSGASTTITVVDEWDRIEKAQTSESVELKPFDIVEFYNSKFPRETLLTLAAPAKLPALLPNKTYKTIAAPAGEYLFRTIRLGAKKQKILCLAPIDAQPFEHIEVDFGKIEQLFPAAMLVMRDLIYGAAKDVLSIAEFGLLEEAMNLDGGGDFDVMEKLFVQTQNRIVKKTVREQKKVAAQEREKTYADNPDWGLF